MLLWRHSRLLKRSLENVLCRRTKEGCTKLPKYEFTKPHLGYNIEKKNISRLNGKTGVALQVHTSVKTQRHKNPPDYPPPQSKHLQQPPCMCLEVQGDAGSTSLSTDKDDTCIYCINIPGCAWGHICTHTSSRKGRSTPPVWCGGLPSTLPWLCCCSECGLTSALCPPCSTSLLSDSEFIMNITVAAETKQT